MRPRIEPHRRVGSGTVQVHPLRRRGGKWQPWVAVNHGRPAVGPRVRQAGLVAVWAGAAGSHPAGTAGRPSPLTPAADPWQRQAADLLLFVGPPLLGGVIAARRPDNRYGWLWLAVGLVSGPGLRHGPRGRGASGRP